MRRLIPILLIGIVLILFLGLVFYQPINVISTWNQLSPPENILITKAYFNCGNILSFSPLPPPGVPNFSPLPPPGVPNFSPLPPPGVPNLI